MWWRFLTFCVLVTLVLFVVLSCIHGRPVIHLFFHRCCGEDIENDQVIFENFGNNFLRERLVGADLIVVDNDSFVSDKDAEEAMALLRDKLNVHDPRSRINVTLITILPGNDTDEFDDSGEATTKRNGDFVGVNVFGDDVLSELDINEIRGVSKPETDEIPSANVESEEASWKVTKEFIDASISEIRELNKNISKEILAQLEKQKELAIKQDFIDSDFKEELTTIANSASVVEISEK